MQRREPLVIPEPTTSYISPLETRDGDEGLTQHSHQLHLRSAPQLLPCSPLQPAKSSRNNTEDMSKAKQDQTLTSSSLTALCIGVDPSKLVCAFTSAPSSQRSFTCFTRHEHREALERNRANGSECTHRFNFSISCSYVQRNQPCVIFCIDVGFVLHTHTYTRFQQSACPASRRACINTLTSLRILSRSPSPAAECSSVQLI